MSAKRERDAESAHSLCAPVFAMLLTVFCALKDRGETTFALEVSPELELRDFLALCELESGIPAGEIQVQCVKYNKVNKGSGLAALLALAS